MLAFLREYRDVAVFFFGWPSLVGVVFATVAGVLERRARRAARAQLWRDAAWGTVAFVIPAALGEGTILAGCTICGL